MSTKRKAFSVIVLVLVGAALLFLGVGSSGAVGWGQPSDTPTADRAPAADRAPTHEPDTTASAGEWRPVADPPEADAAHLPEAAAADDPITDRVVREIRATLERPPPPVPAEPEKIDRKDSSLLTAGGERLRSGDWLGEFYAGRDYAPAWSVDGAPTLAVDSLLGAIRRATLEGLKPADYHQAALLSFLLKIRRHDRPEARDVADLDLLATDAFLTYASHILSGVVDPTTLHRTAGPGREVTDLLSRLEETLEHGRLQLSFRELLFTSHPGYFRLRSALARYRAIEETGDWPLVPESDTLRKGDRGSAVAILRARLAASGDLTSRPRPTKPAPEADPFLFDETLEEAVRGFQRRHGLAVDGVVGPATLGALNVPLAERIRQLELNLERWRWLPRNLGSRYILVNIAAFQTDVFEQIETVMRMRSIVGREYRQTPAFTDTMTYLVFNPSWNVPRALAVREKLPQFQSDPDAVRRLGYRIFEHWGRDAPELDPDTVDWLAISEEEFREFRVWQAPGPNNALGQVKFMFPNAFDVYLHDTPERELFGRRIRDFSAGCIRVENALELAEYLLQGDESWSRERIEEVVAKNRETTVPLPEPIPIHIQYWTAWTESDGTVQFRGDLYNRDAGLRAALEGP